MSALLVLWDIDHTLIELRRLHYDMYAGAFEAAFGTSVETLPDMSGRTDRDSSTKILREHGVEPTDENLHRLWTAFDQTLDRIAPDLTKVGHPTQGAAAALAGLAERPDTYQTVLTGNIRRLAERKITAFDLHHHLDFDLGGYGDDDTNRANLVDVARRRLETKHHIDLPVARLVLIGDTPNDVAAATTSGASIVAVATGPATADDLRRAGAVHVLPDLVDTAAVVRAVGNAA